MDTCNPQPPHMAPYTSRDTTKAAYAPTAADPAAEPVLAHPYNPSGRTPPPNYSYPYNHPQPPTTASAATSSTTGQYGYEYGYSYGGNQTPYGQYQFHHQQQQQQQQQQSLFPPGTDPEVIRSFQLVDRDRSGFIEERELQEALNSSYQRFSLRTIRLLIFLFKNPNESSPRVGPKEFTSLWSCLGQWRAIFERFDRDRSGKINSTELKDAFLSIGYAVPPSIIQVLISRYDDGTGRRVELNFDTFVECGMVIKGMTEKFKEKDARYTGSATLSYDEFLSMIIPFLVCD